MSDMELDQPNVARHALDRVTADHGWAIAGSPARLRAMLNDVLAAEGDDQRRFVDALVVAADEGIPAHLGETYADHRADVESDAVGQLTAWGLSPEMSSWAVASWAAVVPAAVAPVVEMAVTELPPDPPEPEPAHVALEATELPPDALAETPLATELPPEAPDLTELPEQTATPEVTELPDLTELPEATSLPHPTELPTAPEAEVPAHTPEPAASGRRGLVWGAAAAVCAAAVIGGFVLLKPGNDAPASQGNDGNASPAAPKVTRASGTELLATTDTPAPLDAVGVAAKKVGVSLTGLSQPDQAATADGEISAPEGGQLITFSVSDWPCEATACNGREGAFVRVDGERRELPAGDSFVLAVPAGATDASVVLKADGTEQAISLLDGTPSDGAILALTREQRSFRIGKRITLTETASTPLNYDPLGVTDQVSRKVVVRDAKLRYFVPGAKAPAADEAYLQVVMDFRLAYAGKTRGCGPAQDQGCLFDPAEVVLITGDGSRLKPLPASDAFDNDIVFRVPADTTAATLKFGGSRSFDGGFTLTVSHHSVPLTLP